VIQTTAAAYTTWPGVLAWRLRRQYLDHRATQGEAIPVTFRYVGCARSAAYVKEQRCWRTGTQLTSGIVLHEIGLNHRLFKSACGVLRGASDGVGFGHTDGARRRHKLYA
jgi:hypothetical protein